MAAAYYQIYGLEGFTHVVGNWIDAASGLASRVSVTPMVWVDARPNQGLRYHILSAGADHFSFQLFGSISPEYREALGQFLDEQGIPSVPRDDAVRLIFSLYTDEEEEMLARVRIERYYDMIMPGDDDQASIDYDLEFYMEKVIVGEGDGADIRDTRCAVCLDEFSTGTEVMMTMCCHFFHGDCIGRWLKTRAVCPMCRFDLSM